MGQVLRQGLMQGWEPVEAEAHINNELAGWGFSEGERGQFGKQVLG